MEPISGKVTPPAFSLPKPKTGSGPLSPDTGKQIPPGQDLTLQGDHDALKDHLGNPSRLSETLELGVLGRDLSLDSPMDWDALSPLAPLPEQSLSRKETLTEYFKQYLGHAPLAEKDRTDLNFYLNSDKTDEEIRLALFHTPAGQAFKAKVATELTQKCGNLLGAAMEDYLQMLDEGHPRAEVERKMIEAADVRQRR